MKCIVCNKEFSSDACPRCRFPVVEFPGDYEAGMRALKPTIDKYRTDFYSRILLGITVYFGKDKNGSVVQDRKENIPFGSIAELSGKEHWLEQKFARIPDVKTLTLNCCIKNGDFCEEKAVSINNLSEPEFQNIGIYTDGNIFRLLLKNESGKQTRSQDISVFSD